MDPFINTISAKYPAEIDQNSRTVGELAYHTKKTFEQWLPQKKIHRNILRKFMYFAAALNSAQATILPKDCPSPYPYFSIRFYFLTFLLCFTLLHAPYNVSLLVFL